MPLDNSQIKIHWHEIIPQVLNHWKKLSKKEVEKTQGNTSSLSHLVKSKYGRNVDFDKEYERICRPFAEKAKANLYSGKSFSEEPDDMDEEGMTRFDESHADYTGMPLNDSLKEVELPIKPETDETSIIQHPDKKTAPDEIKPNQDPHFSQSEDITSRGSNSSANTTSPSALYSSGATTKL